MPDIEGLRAAVAAYRANGRLECKRLTEMHGSDANASEVSKALGRDDADTLREMGKKCQEQRERERLKAEEARRAQAAKKKKGDDQR